MQRSIQAVWKCDSCGKCQIIPLRDMKTWIIWSYSCLTNYLLLKWVCSSLLQYAMWEESSSEKTSNSAFQTPKEAENHLLRLGLHLMPVHTAAGVFTVTTTAKNECSDASMRRFVSKPQTWWLTLIFMLCHSEAWSGADVAGRPGGASTFPSDKNKIHGIKAKVD